MTRAVVLAILAGGCGVVTPATAPTSADAGVAVSGATVCSHLRALGCPEGSPSPKGGTCEALYLRVGDSSLDGRCVAGATSIDELQADCNVECKTP